jgi:hypothetical protein
VPIFTFGSIDPGGDVVRDPAFPDLPSVRDVYLDLFGHEPTGIEWEAYKTVLAVSVSAGKTLWLHGDAPPAAIAALRQAAADIAADPEFLAAARTEVGDYPFHVGEGLTQAMGVASGATPESVRWIQDLLREKYGVDRLQVAR